MADATARKIAESDSDTIVGSIDSFLNNRDLSSNQVAECYDRWASSYEADLGRVKLGYNNPQQVTEALIASLPEGVDRSNLLILDVACGTGLAAERLKNLGFRRIHGLDGSAGMIEKAGNKGLYESLNVEFVTDKPLATVNQNFYDAVVTTGSFCPNHLGPSCLRTLGDLLKSGGLLAIAMRKSFTITDPVLQQMEPELKHLEADGYWRIERMEETANYYGEEAGMIYVMKKN